LRPDARHPRVAFDPSIALRGCPPAGFRHRNNAMDPDPSPRTILPPPIPSIAAIVRAFVR
jgi:hypothetical protein